MTAFPIPDAALDGRIAIVGLAGSGKSTTAKGGVERLLATRQRVCIVDLTDGWWGLRLRRDGKRPAFAIAIFGGRHGDLPLNEHAGAVIGQAVALSQEPTIVSLAELDSDAARRRFALAFFDALHRHNRAPLHLVLDEADFYAPQNPVKDGPGPLLLNRVKEIASRGRIRGFRLWPITQRPAKLHKDVLSQAETLVAMQLTASQDRNAIKAWISDQADESAGKDILATLPRLKRGQGVVWSPRLGILEPVHFPLPETYDSSRTPEHGEAVPDVELARLDLPALRERMAAVEEETRASDPKALRARIKELEAEVFKLGHDLTPKPDPAALAEAERTGYQRGVLTERQALSDRLGASSLESAAREAGILAIAMQQQVEQITRGVRAALSFPASAPVAQPVEQGPHKAQVAGSSPAVRTMPGPHARSTGTPKAQPQVKAIAAVGTALPGPQQRILDAIAWWGRVGVDQPSRVQVAVVAGYSPYGGAFQNPLGTLRTAGLIDYPQTGIVALTAAGVRHARWPEAIGATADLHAKVMAILDGPRRRILQPLLDAYPRALTREALAAAAGYEPSGGAFQNPLGALRSLGLIDYPERGKVAALPILFLEGR